jgi:hypothetical protein
MGRMWDRQMAVALLAGQRASASGEEEREPQSLGAAAALEYDALTAAWLELAPTGRHRPRRHLAACAAADWGLEHGLPCRAALWRLRANATRPWRR